MKKTIEIEIRDIKVDERYYSFEYIVKISGKKIFQDLYESDYEGWTIKEFRKHLKSNGALAIVCEIIGESL